MLKGLKFGGHEGSNVGSMCRGHFVEALVDGTAELRERAVRTGVQRRFLDEFPQPLDKIQMCPFGKGA
jgi:hypothetical protein